MHDSFRKALALAAAVALTVLPASPAFADNPPTATPIKHLVILFQENVTFPSITTLEHIPMPPTPQDNLRFTRGAAHQR